MSDLVPGPLPARIAVAVIGGGQSGLAMSWHLAASGTPHIVLERHRPGHAWHSERWDSFCLVTPNWQCRLPGFPYDGPDPDGFMVRDDIVRYIEDYARAFGAPLHTGTTVERVRKRVGGFEITTDRGAFIADRVVVATGGYHRPIVPPEAASLDPTILQIDARRYKNAGTLPKGGVLVVGSGQSGAQIAEDLHLAGRETHLAVGRAPRVSRRYRGRDVVEWMDLMKFYELPVERHPLGERVRDNTNHYVTGRDGGRDIDLRAHARTGLHLHGRLAGVSGGSIHFGDDLADNLDRADTINADIKRSIDKWIAANGVEAPVEAPYAPVWTPDASRGADPLDLGAAGIRTVVWCTGYRMDFGWIDDLPVDGRGRPLHARGVSRLDGLMFLGLPWQHTWGSARFSGVASDAAFLADHLRADVAAQSVPA